MSNQNLSLDYTETNVLSAKGPKFNLGDTVKQINKNGLCPG